MVGLWNFDIRLADCDCQYDHAFVGCGDIGDADLVWSLFNELTRLSSFLIRQLTPACAVEVVVVDVVG